MTSVLQATDVLSFNRFMNQADDDRLQFSSNTDWKTKYYEVFDMLNETRADLEEFQVSSRELEEELNLELERTDKAQNELKQKVLQVEAEREEWKTKFMQLQTTHNNATTQMQRELDALRESQRMFKEQVRELEMGNDDLERNERTVTASLADLENRYIRVMEEKILLEHEVQDKGKLEEELQRSKDELRDVLSEVSVLKDQLERERLLRTDTKSSSTLDLETPQDDAQSLLSEGPPDLLLSDLTVLTANDPAPEPPTPTTKSTPAPTSKKSDRLDRTIGPDTTPTSTPVNNISRATTIPSLSASRLPSPTYRRPTTQPLAFTPSASPNPAGSQFQRPGMPARTAPASRSRGVQMISAMRAKVTNMEQKIHTRVPRLRNISVRGPLFDDGTPGGDAKGKGRAGSGTDSPGWVLVTEEGSMPSPTYKTSRASIESTRSSRSSPPPSSFPHSVSGLRPPSRYSDRTKDTTDGLLSPTTASTSSRPSTPTFLPMPVSGHLTPGPSKRTAARRSSVGPASMSQSVSMPHHNNSRPTSVPAPPRNIPPVPPLPPLPPKSATSMFLPSKSTAGLPLPTKGTTAKSKLGLGMSRIGRPNSLGITRGGGSGSASDVEGKFNRRVLGGADALASAESDRELGRTRSESVREFREF